MKDKKLICSAPTKSRLKNLINEFYYSENYFINEQLMLAENKKTGKKLGKITKENNRWKYYA